MEVWRSTSCTCQVEGYMSKVQFEISTPAWNAWCALTTHRMQGKPRWFAEYKFLIHALKKKPKQTNHEPLQKTKTNTRCRVLLLSLARGASWSVCCRGTASVRGHSQALWSPFSSSDDRNIKYAYCSVHCPSFWTVNKYFTSRAEHCQQ